MVTYVDKVDRYFLGLRENPKAGEIKSTSTPTFVSVWGSPLRLGMAKSSVIWTELREG